MVTVDNALKGLTDEPDGPYDEPETEDDEPQEPANGGAKGQPEPGQAIQVTVSAPREHGEATCLAFTQLFDQQTGAQWNVTLREGVTSAHMDRLFTAMQYTGKIAKKHGFGLERPGVSAPPAPTNGGGKPPAYERDGEGQPTPAPAPPLGVTRKPPLANAPQPATPVPPPASRAVAAPTARNTVAVGEQDVITRLVILPNMKDPEKPRVEFWGKPNLKYAITSAPAWLVAQKLQERYQIEESELSFLYEVGAQWKVNWKIELVASDRLNSRGTPYKDLGQVIDMDREN